MIFRNNIKILLYHVFITAVSKNSSFLQRTRFHPSFHQTRFCDDSSHTSSLCAQHHTGSHGEEPGADLLRRVSSLSPGGLIYRGCRGRCSYSVWYGADSGMAEAELQSFTSIMDALVRISVSTSL